MNTRTWRTIGALTVSVVALAACGSDTDSPSDPTISPGDGGVVVPGDDPVAPDEPVETEAPIETEAPVDTEAPVETEAPTEE